jgi:hypothetical protein
MAGRDGDLLLAMKGISLCSWSNERKRRTSAFLSFFASCVSVSVASIDVARKTSRGVVRPSSAACEPILLYEIVRLRSMWNRDETYGTSIFPSSSSDSPVGSITSMTSSLSSSPSFASVASGILTSSNCDSPASSASSTAVASSLAGFSSATMVA